MGMRVSMERLFGVIRRDGIIGVRARVYSRAHRVRTIRQPVIRKWSHRELFVINHTVVQHSATVDVIVCVHNAIDDVRRCLESVVRFTLPPYTLIVVDDGSDEATRQFLNNFCMAQGATLHRNKQAVGYTRAANQAMQVSSAEYVVLLNSDAIVSEHWIDRLTMCAESDPTIGLVGPLSNTASWQSVPNVLKNGDWDLNDLPSGFDTERMARLVAASSGRVYPRVPFLNGFCLLIKRDVCLQIGYFDENSFGEGYGEENDYGLRARNAGWTLAVADDCYVYHAQSRSYSSERRRQLCERADRELQKKHGKFIVESGVSIIRDDRVLEGIRARTYHAIARTQLRARAAGLWEGRRILFVLPITDACGGANVIISETRALISMGIDARIVNFSEKRDAFISGYPNLDVPIIFIRDPSDIAEEASGFDAIIATSNISVKWLIPVKRRFPNISIGYYIQDFEPYFYELGTESYKEAITSYTLIPNMVCFTKTHWNKNEVELKTGVKCEIVGPSVNIDLFRPRPRKDELWPARPLRIAAMIRPSTPRRGAKITMNVLSLVKSRYREDIEIVLFGSEATDPEFIELKHDFRFENYGLLGQQALASLFNDVDIFVDFSNFQAMGLTAMEAMCCGVAVIVPEQGGATCFAKHERNALVVDSRDEQQCRLALERLVDDHEFRARIQKQALIDVVQWHPVNSAVCILQSLWPNKEFSRR